ncbi:hypothetical protein C0J52_00883 [Blattella germanica]|nr:hypothetical protein C0J52_00883 [Blattella germanica]
MPLFYGNYEPTFRRWIGRRGDQYHQVLDLDLLIDMCLWTDHKFVKERYEDLELLNWNASKKSTIRYLLT